jgi:hypothetical protein
MSVGRFLQQGAAGNAGEAVYVDDVFSTYLYTGNGSAQTITNGIDLDGEGGMLWIKNRDAAVNHQIHDTERGASVGLNTNNSNAEYTDANAITSFNSDGFSMNNNYNSHNQSGVDFVSWTFRKQRGFFDVVTYTGNGSSGVTRTLSHNLGSVPGMIIVKNTTQTSNWAVYHRGVDSSSPENYNLYLDATNGRAISDLFGSTAPTATEFTVGWDSDVNANGQGYVAYLFAHDAQDFGTDSDESIIKCGSYTGTGSAQDIDLGFEPQWILIKRASASASWILLDSMRGIVADGIDPDLHPDDTTYDSQQGAVNFAQLNADGIKIDPGSNGYGGVNANGSTYIYVAIRRPHKPASEFAATDLFSARYGSNSANEFFNTGFDGDLIFSRDTVTATQNNFFGARLTGQKQGSQNLIWSNNTTAETATSGRGYFGSKSRGYYYEDARTSLSYLFRRAPGFFDVVTYTGSVSAQEIPHNLGVAPELIIQKCRTQGSYPWNSWYTGLTNSQYINFNASSGVQTSSNLWGTNATVATDSVFRTGGGNTGVDGSTSDTHIAYLFASVDGISKVGTFNRPSQVAQDIDCGFENGARFVLIKRTNTTGNWVLWDSVRGIVAGNEPYLLTNSNAAQVTNQDYIDPLSSGFTLTSGIATGDWVFLAIA